VCVVTVVVFSVSGTASRMLVCLFFSQYGGKIGNTMDSHRMIEMAKKVGKQDAVVEQLMHHYVRFVVFVCVGVVLLRLLTFLPVAVVPPLLPSYLPAYQPAYQPACQPACLPASACTQFELEHSLSDRSVLLEVAEATGLEGVGDMLDSDAGKREVSAMVRHVRSAYGVTGVPFFVVGDTFSFSGAQESDTIVDVIKQVIKKQDDEAAKSQGESKM